MKNYFLNKAEEREKKAAWDFETRSSSKYVKIEIKNLIPGKIPIKNFYVDVRT